MPVEPAAFYQAMQRLRSAGLQLNFQYGDRQPQRFSHKTRLTEALAELDAATAEVRAALVAEGLTDG